MPLSSRPNGTQVGASLRVPYPRHCVSTWLLSNTSRETLAYLFVDSERKLDEVLARLGSASRIALDTEADSLYHYYEKVCLIQISLENENYIIDPLADLNLDRLLSLLAESALVMHGADYDLRLMRASYRFEPRGRIFDTMIAAQLLGYEQLSLNNLAERLCGAALGSRSQRSNWAHRPLTGKQLSYACDDTRFLFDMADQLEAELDRRDRLEWHRESCEWMARATARNHERDPDKLWRIKGVRDLNRRQLGIVRELWHWREREAQSADRPAFKIMPNSLIIDLATWATSHPDLPMSLAPKLPVHFSGARVSRLRKSVQVGLSLSEEDLPAFPRRSGRRPDPLPELDPLREACARIAGKLEIEPSVLAPKAALIAITRERSTTIDAMMKTGPLMGWQAQQIQPVVEEILG